MVAARTRRRPIAGGEYQAVTLLQRRHLRRDYLLRHRHQLHNYFLVLADILYRQHNLDQELQYLLAQKEHQNHHWHHKKLYR